MTIHIYNVLSKKKEPLVPLRENELRVYICGVTVYGASHIGHLRCYLSFDAVLRYLKHRGYNVRYVRNFTDIDDKIIQRAREIEAGPEGTWRNAPAYSSYDDHLWECRLQEDAQIRQRAVGQTRHLAEIVSDHFIDLFRESDFAPFGLLPPESEPRVSQYIPKVIALIEKIIANGFAYAVDGDVYFDVPAYHQATKAYGKLSGRDYTQLVEGARVAPSDKKRSAPDFALWKASSEGEPSWPSPWGAGRPGWHIECSAMSADKLGLPFDIHGGGKDLIFPHHENEIAQSEAAFGGTFCNTWMHNGFVTVDGVKMSKSLGNFMTIQDALKVAPPEVWRFLLLGTHYAKPIDLSRTNDEAGGSSEQCRGNINIAFERLTYFYETLCKSDKLANQESAEMAPPLPLATDVVAEFTAAMDDDFNTARALAAIGEGMKELNELCDLKPKAVKKLSGGEDAWRATIGTARRRLLETAQILGLLTSSPTQAIADLREFAITCRGLDRIAIEEKIAQRNQARGEKDFALSDRLRDELLAIGVELCDTPQGTQWKVLR